MSTLITPEWPAPDNIRAYSTTRAGGESAAPWDTLNLGGHVGDDPAHVIANRNKLISIAGLPSAPVWLNQVHGIDVVRLPYSGEQTQSPSADAAWTDRQNVVCTVMTADCLPVLFCSYDGSEVAAAHAGWRGLCQGVLEATLACFRTPAAQIHAWLGPAIGPDAFEVGPEVRQAFMAHSRESANAFYPSGEKYMADIWLLARQRLAAAGVCSVSGGGLCTVHHQKQFYSWRRDRVTGRMASLIWRV